MVAVITALLVRRYLFCLIIVKGVSMMNTLHNGDRLYVSILTGRIRGYRRGDVIICRFPGRKELFVKRIIALPQDTILIENGHVFVNGKALAEPYVNRPGIYSAGEITLKDHEYFVLGDNRSVSHDSHSRDVGPVSQIIGKARAVIWPLKRIGRIN